MATPVEQWLPGMDITAGRLEAMNQTAYLTVTNYGADPSGTVNAHTEIQAALNDARDRGGAQVLVPPGVYLIGATLRIYQNTRLTLMHGAEFRRNFGGRMLVNGDAGQDLGGYTGHGNIVIEGGLWNMRGTNPGMTSSAMCMSIGHAQDVLVQEVDIIDVPGYHAIELNSTFHGVIRNCRFRGFIDPGGRDISEAVQLDLSKNVAGFGAFGPYDNTPCEDVLITGCFFGASGTPGTTAWPRGIGSHTTTRGRWHRHIRISDNSFVDLLQFAISAYNYEDVTINGNTFVGCGSGVRLRVIITSDPGDTAGPDGVPTGLSQNMRNITITGNSFRQGGSYGQVIVAQGEATGTILNLAITGNTIDGTSGTQTGIRLNYVSRATVVGNVIANTNGTSISTEQQNNTVIADNVVWGSNAHGITMVDSQNSNILNNQVRDPANNGILVQTSTDVQIRNNFVDGPNRVNVPGTSAYGIRISDTNSNIAVTGNKCRPGSSTVKALNGLSMTSSVSFATRYGNDMRGTWTGAGIADTSTSGSTVATDLS
ncbi:right-handed parallel beta-helix repeat-containing protein [Streptomyces albidoflavus]|uniref:right-handed parallel beta-helix repeat-containing protein n=1 Tax=Streptomyces albidoflavus TaxID=1886 RepID=UPI0033E38986